MRRRFGKARVGLSSLTAEAGTGLRGCFGTRRAEAVTLAAELPQQSVLAARGEGIFVKATS